MSEHSECVVLDVTDSDQWSQPYGGLLIPVHKRSTVVQPDRETAEREAVRLAQAHPGHHFAVFALLGIVESKEIPTHTTLGGTVMATARKPVWRERDL